MQQLWLTARALSSQVDYKITLAIPWTLGECDLISVGEWPDEQTAVAFALAVGCQGNVRTTRLRAYTEDEMTGISGKLG